jgi:hypothetical protein
MALSPSKMTTTMMFTRAVLRSFPRQFRRPLLFRSFAGIADIAFEGVSDEVSKQIYLHAHQPQTAVSLQTLLQTGRGEFLHKTYKTLEHEERGATEQVLTQVS